MRYDECHYAECRGAPFQSSLIFASKVRSLPKRGAPYKTLILPANIRLGWQDLPETHTLAYLASSSVMKKSIV